MIWYLDLLRNNLYCRSILISKKAKFYRSISIYGINGFNLQQVFCSFWTSFLKYYVLSGMICAYFMQYVFSALYNFSHASFARLNRTLSVTRPITRVHITLQCLWKPILKNDFKSFIILCSSIEFSYSVIFCRLATICLFYPFGYISFFFGRFPRYFDTFRPFFNFFIITSSWVICIVI